MAKISVDKILEKLSLEDLVGQVLCYDISDNDDPKEVEEIIKNIRPGGIFITHMTAEKIKMYTEMVGNISVNILIWHRIWLKIFILVFTSHSAKHILHLKFSIKRTRSLYQLSLWIKSKIIKQRNWWRSLKLNV